MLLNRVYLGENDYICSVLLKDDTRHRLLHHRITTSKIKRAMYQKLLERRAMCADVSMKLLRFVVNLGDA